MYTPIEHPDYPGWFKIPNFDRRPIVNLERYLVNKEGNFLNIKTGHITKGGDRSGREYLQININNRPESTHRLACAAFYGPPQNGDITNHINGIKSDNRAENLEWVSYSRNSYHAFENKLNYSANKKQIFIFDILKNKVDTYESAEEFMRINPIKLNLSRSGIFNALNRNSLYLNRLFIRREPFSEELLAELSETVICRKDIFSTNLAVFPNIFEAARLSGVSKIELRQLLKDKKQYLGKYLFKTLSDKTPWLTTEEVKCLLGEDSADILLIDASKGIKYIFSSIMEVSEFTGIYRQKVAECLRDKTKSLGNNLLIKYLKDPNPQISS